MYLALYRKWRPQVFDDVIGQEPITTTLKNQVKHGQTAHAYLFTGSRGTGKTTCSKILAMAVNCLNPQDGNPCLACNNCKGIEDGSLLDVLEIDAASNNGVSDVRLLREEANYTPTQAKFRVYIIDETHMLSGAAFNALLKTMEEPPAHVMFILATTEAHKVPATIVSRCQRFDFHRIATTAIADRLAFIADKEPFTLTKEGAALIARLADGGMRDALSVLDQCTAFSEAVDETVVATAAGLVMRDYLFDLATQIQAQETAEVLKKLDELHQNSKDLQRLVAELLDHYRNLMIAKTVKDPDTLISCLPEELLRLQEQAKDYPLDDILHCMTTLQTCQDDMAKAANRRMVVEMAMIGLCKPAPTVGGTATTTALPKQLLARLEQLEKLVAAMASGQIAVKKQPTPTAQPAVAVQEEEDPPIDTTPQLFAIWQDVLEQLREADPMMFGMLAGSVAHQAGRQLLIDSPNALLPQMIRKENMGKKLLDLLEEQTGTRFRLRVKAPNKPTVEETSPLSILSQKAKELGIPVEVQE